MPYLNESQLKKNIRAKNISNLYVIYGDEAYLKNHYLNLIISASVTKGFESFNLHRFNAQNLKSGDALNLLSNAFSASLAVPIMGGYNCIVIKDMALQTLKDKDLEYFKTNIEQIPKTTIIIFFLDQIEVSTKKYDPWNDILDFCAKHGACVALNKRKQREILALISSGIEKRGCTISPKTAEYLIFYSGNDLQALLNEVEKLSAFKRSGEITKEDIQAVCIKSVEASVFDLAKTIIGKNADQAFFILNTLLAQKTEPTIILGTLASAFTDIYRVKTAEAENKNTGELSRSFSYKSNTFRLNNASRLGYSMPLNKLRKGIEILSKADIDIKFSSKPNALILEQLLIELLNV